MSNEHPTPEEPQHDAAPVDGEPAPERASESANGPFTPTSADLPEPAQEGASTTPSGYSYTVVDDEDDVASVPASGRRALRVPAMPRAVWLVALAVVPAVVVGLAVWLFAPGDDGGGDSRAQADVGNVLNAFTGGQSSISRRYEGELAPGYPEEVPEYPGAEVVSSVVQIDGEDASYLAIYDTKDAREDVAGHFEEQLREDPWQVNTGQDGRHATLLRFTRIDDANIEGIVVVAQSADDEITTIVHSIQVVGGGEAARAGSFELPDARELPEGFPDQIPAYKDALVIETAFQSEGGARQFVVSWLTKDDGGDVLDFYRDSFGDANVNVEDTEPAEDAPAGAESIAFGDEDLTLQGGITVTDFAEDESYTRIDVTVQVDDD